MPKAIRTKASPAEIRDIRAAMGWDEFTRVGPGAIQLFVAGRLYERRLVNENKISTDLALHKRMEQYAKKFVKGELR